MSHPSPSDSPQPAVSPESINRVEQVFETIVFASRWIQAPLYGGLIIAELLYAYKFLVELWEMIYHIQDHSETIFMLGVLSLIDITMVANLLVMVIIGGYATFVSRLSLDDHEDRPDWLEKVDAGSIKVKMAASLVGVSGIHLLKTFINIDNKSPVSVKWQVIIHLVFLGSTIALAAAEVLMKAKNKKV